MYYSPVLRLLPVYLLVIKYYIVVNSSPITARISETGSSHFQSDIIWSSVPIKLKNCSVILLHEDSSIEDTTEALLKILEYHDRFLLSVEDINVTSSSLKLVDVHKLRDRCVLGLVQVSNVRKANQSELLYEVLKGLDETIKKDEDYFIFYSPRGESINDLFSSGPVASGVKNKLGIKFRNNTIASYYATCFFCDSGKPSLQEISIPTRISPGFHLSTLTSSMIMFPDLLSNFHGKQFGVSSPTLARWLNEIREISPGYWVNRRGVFNTALEHVMWKYNFTAKYFPSTGGGGTGYRYANGTWIGSVGDVLSGRADIGSTTGQVYSRNLVVGLSVPILYEWLTFTTGQPRPHYSWKSVYWPLTPLSWLLVIGSIVIAFFVITCLLKTMRMKVSTKETAMYLFQTFLEQDGKGLDRYTKSNTTRMFLAFWLIFALLITTAYRSKLVSFLAFPMTEEQPKTFKSLAHAVKFQIALQYLRGAAYSMLKTSPNPTFQAIYRRMELEENDAKCFQRAIGTHFSCISWDSVADFVYHKNLSDKHGRVPLIKAPDTMTFIAVGLIFHKRAVFRPKFDEVLARAVGMGLVGKWKQLDYEFIRNERKKWERVTNKTQVVYAFNTDEFLTLKHLSGTFFILVVGILFGLCAFIFEIVTGKCRKIEALKNRKDWDTGSAGIQLHLLVTQRA